MNEIIMFKLLDLIDKKTSIGTLFKLGYSYSNIVKWYLELELDGYVFDENGEYKYLTSMGKRKLKELKEKNNYESIGRLEQYRVLKKSIEEIYLP